MADPSPVLIRLVEAGRVVYAGEFAGPVELGRQAEPSEVVDAGRRAGGRGRVVVARLDEQTVSRRHAEVEALASGLVRLSNLSGVNAIGLTDGRQVGPGASIELPGMVGFGLGRKTVFVEVAEPEGGPILGLEGRTLAPGGLGDAARTLAPGPPPIRGDRVDTDSLVGWLRAVLDVVQTAAGSSDFFQRAARAVVDVVGLDEGRVLLRDGDAWRVEAAASGDRDDGAGRGRPSRRVLARLREERRTLWQDADPACGDGEGASLAGVAAVVASPILDRRGEVIGALYGERHRVDRGRGLPRVERIDALLLELLACGVAAGLARVEQERAALAARVQFEQFFTPELARELASRPDLLEGRHREVTLLFCDVRGFSRISGRIGTGRTMSWMGETLDALSACVQAHRGVLVDYIGDELIAMWGAPNDEPEHPRLACLAALDILRALGPLNARWAEELGEPFGVGVGINTGPAHVGNIGSSFKFKYGALGGTVNLASRVQGATRHLKAAILITAATEGRIGPGFRTRKLGRVAVVNIAEPIDLYELAPDDRPGWGRLKEGYDLALARYEARDFREAARTLGNLLAEHPDDGPSLLLLSRAVDALIRGQDDFDPVLRLPTK